MKNIEKYRNELLIAIEESSVCIFAKKRGIPVDNCIKHNCVLCKETLVDWLLEEYEPQIDWSKVPVDTPVVVSHIDEFNQLRHFARFNDEYNDCFVTFEKGRTSFTSNGHMEYWLRCKLAREEDIEKYSIQ